MSLRRPESPAAVMLASLVMGILTAPCLYIALGALASYSAAFSLIFLPPLVLALAYLGWRFLRRSMGQGNPFLLRILDGLGLALVLFFAWVVSHYTLFSITERLGLLSVFLLVGSLAWLPLMIWRPTSLEQRIQAWPRRFSLGLLLLAVIALATGGMLYVMGPRPFL